MGIHEAVCLIFLGIVGWRDWKRRVWLLGGGSAPRASAAGAGAGNQRGHRIRGRIVSYYGWNLSGPLGYPGDNPFGTGAGIFVGRLPYGREEEGEKRSDTISAFSILRTGGQTFVQNRDRIRNREGRQV